MQDCPYWIHVGGSNEGVGRSSASLYWLQALAENIYRALQKATTQRNNFKLEYSVLKIAKIDIAYRSAETSESIVKNNFKFTNRVDKKIGSALIWI